MELEVKTPSQSLNVAYLKQSLSEQQIDLFKTELKKTFLLYNELESEEYHKNLISDFLKNVYCKDQYLINVNKRNDLVIRHGNTINNSIGVILEFKKPTEKTDMVGKENANVKALHELVLYYLRETIDNNKHEIKYLIATSINEWFVFDELWFEKNIYKNTQLIKDYTNYKTSGHNTEHFYKLIAAKHLAAIEDKLVCTYFNLNDFKAILDSTDEEENNRLIALYKILSPQHLLKKPFANDSNTLNKEFYNELLHIMGLEECNDGGKRVIIQKPKNNRDEGSLIENTINILKRQKKIADNESEQQCFEIAIELCILWLNRILFLKLLEGQLINYHKGDKTNYSFLTTDTNNKISIQSFDELDELFFEVLAVHPLQRGASIIDKYKNLPYLNSSLFELSDFETKYITINQLKGRLELPIYAHTVLKDANGKPITGKKPTLHYLFEFLDAYNFATEGVAKIQKENKTLINASVLGLIFEKINGYKDGSFFTPGFITMYMCRETINRIVLDRFNEAKKWDCKDFFELKDKINYTDIKEREQANAIINSIKICDPAVGSGHFLVSALNQLIATKSELKILNYRDGSRIKEWQIAIEHDELIVKNVDDDQLFAYSLNKNNKSNGELQNLQETLFHEKQTIIENCLFGVDINPKSVSICRLRLWIELLKNTYYTKDSQFQYLETLPNIDINIKCGNSLISRFAIDDKNNILSKDRVSVKRLIEKYKVLVDGYKNAIDYKAKADYRRQIGYLKTEFEKFTFNNDKDYHLLAKKEKEFTTKQSEIPFGNAEERKVWEAAINTLATEVTALRTLYEDKLKTLYTNAIEWRFEFPEVLNDDGEFIGFDAVMGNPPYYSVSTSNTLKLIATNYQSWCSTGDVYALFYELGQRIVKESGYENFIISNKWMRANYGESLRVFILLNTNPLLLVDFGQNLIFDNAVVHTNIILSKKQVFSNNLSGIRFADGKFYEMVDTFGDFVKLNITENIPVDKGIWNIISSTDELLKTKIEQHKKLIDWDINIYRGILTGYNEAFIIDEETKQSLIKKDSNNENIIKPILRGRDTRRYYCNFANLYVINAHNGYKIGDKKIDSIKVERDYPFIYKHLLKYEAQAKERNDKGWHWTNLRSCAYIDEFAKPKIIFSEIVSEPQFYYDEKGYFPEATVFFITGSHLKYLLALLNSKAVTYFFKSYYMGGELVGKIRYKKIFLEQIPIPVPTEEQQNEITTLVDNIIAQKQKGADTKDLENQIDSKIYALYDLTATEIAVIEGGE